MPIRTCSLTSRTSKTRPYATRLDQIHVFPRCKIYMSSYSAVACPEGKDRGIAAPNLLQIFKTYSKLIRTVFVYRYTASVGYFIFACMNVHRESKKTRHQTLGHNFTNYYTIFKIFSLADSVVNLQQTPV